MCPLCLGTAWLVAGGVSSVGGAATVAWRSIAKRRRSGTGRPDPVMREGQAKARGDAPATPGERAGR